MSHQTLEADTLQNLYDEWFEVRLKDIDRLEEIKAKIDDKVKHIKGYIFTHPDYWLISLGHDLMLENLNEAKVSLDQLEQLKNELEDRYRFYYYFFKAIYYLARGDLKESQLSFKLTKENLRLCFNQADKADYYFKVGSLYYHLKKTIDSTHHLSTALSLFLTQISFEKRIAACQIALGLNSIDLHQWEDAEERFYSALNYANKADDKSLKAVIYHDLGLLYSEQNMSKAAIHWLIESTKLRNPPFPTCYLICREYFKINQFEEAESWYLRGYEDAKKQGSRVFITRFELLYVLYKEKDQKVVKNTLIQGIDFFLEEKLWTFVDENAKKLAEIYSKEEKYKEAVKYYRLHIMALEKINEMEALK